jgi:hypothetical protein
MYMQELKQQQRTESVTKNSIYRMGEASRMDTWDL